MTNRLALGRITALMLGGTCALALSAGAAAQEEVSGTRDSTIATADVGDVTITDSGRIAGPLVGIELNADATVRQNGEIDFDDAAPQDGALGVRVNNDVSFIFSQDGTIDLTDSAAEVDGTNPPAFATGRFGVLIEPGTFEGDVTFSSTSRIDVDGDQSGGVVINGALIGDVVSDGDIRVRGAESVGFAVDGPVTGDITFDAVSAIAVRGVNSDAIRISGEVDGAVLINGILSASGFEDVVADDEDTAEGLAANDFQRGLVSGNAINITGGVTGGVLLENRPGDTVLDDQFVVVGEGNALRVSGAGGQISLGAIQPGTEIETDADGNETEVEVPVDEGTFAIINRAGLETNPVYSGLTGEAVRLENAILEGGFANSGLITTRATDAVARAVALGDGLVAPTVYNRRTVTAVSNLEAVGFDVAAGATVTSFVNDGTLQVSSTGGNARAVRDAGGSISTVTNTGRLEALTAADSEGNEGVAVAVDLGANTTGVVFTNTFNPDFLTDEATEDDRDALRSVSGLIAGDIITGSGNDQFLSDAGVVVGDVSLGAGNDLARLSDSSGVGGIVDLGAGDNTLTLMSDAFIDGGAVFGAGSSALSLSGGSSFTGTIDNAGALSIDVDDSSLTIAGDVAGVTDLTVANESVLGIQVSADGTIGSVTADTVSIADGTELRTVFEGAFVGETDGPQPIVIANTLNADRDALQFNQDGQTPFLFDLDLIQEGNSLLLDLQRRTAEEVGIRAGAQDLLDPAIASLAGNATIGASLFNATTQADFLGVFNQLLPQPLDAPIAYAQQQNSILTSLVTQRTDILARDGEVHGTAWLQEQTYFLDRGSDASSNGFDGGGFVVAVGADRPLFGIDLVGIAGHFASARYDEQTGEDFPFNRTTFGLDVYAAERIGSIAIDGRAGYAWTSSDSERNVVADGSRQLLEAEWDGTQITANGRVRYITAMGKTNIQPFIGLDYLSLQDDAYQETGDASIALVVDETEWDSLRGSVGVSLSRVFETKPNAYSTGIPARFEPRITAAYSREFITDDYEQLVRFVAAGADAPFTLLTAEPEESVATVAADLLYENAYAKILAGGTLQVGENVDAIGLRVGIGLKW